MTILFDAGEYSLDQRSVGGIGLRIAELATALAGHFDVRIYSPATADEPIETGDARLTSCPGDWDKLLAEATATFFFDMPNRGRMQDAASARRLLVSENAPPIEQLDYPSYRDSGGFDRTKYDQLLDTYRYQLTTSHHFVARSNIERLTLIANLCALGSLTHTMVQRSRRLTHVVTTVPIGFTVCALSNIQTAINGERPHELIWTGGLWDYMNPGAAVRAVGRARELGVDLRLRFLHAAAHPDTLDVVEEVRESALSAAVSDLIYMHTEPVAHRDRDAYLQMASAFICLAKPGIENETCIRLRVRDSRLHGIPLVVDHYGATATELSPSGLAVIVDPNDIDGVAKRMIEVDDSRSASRFCARSERTHWTYERTIAPLVEYLHRELTS